jgi:membrane protein required for colicin V production
MSINFVDVVIVILVVASAFAGLRSGLVRCLFSLVGLIAGIAFASRNYEQFASRWPLTVLSIHSAMLLDALWFCLLALAVMLVAALFGAIIRHAVKLVGLGWLDNIAGFLFGILRGGVLVVLFILTLAAFFPETRWLGDAQLAKYFMGVTHVSTEITPSELKQRVVEGLRVAETDTNRWLRPERH